MRFLLLKSRGATLLFWILLVITLYAGTSRAVTSIMPANSVPPREGPEPEVAFGAVTFTGGGAGTESNVITVYVNLSEVSREDVTIPFLLGGTAKEGVDFTVSTNPLIIKAGKFKGAITLTMVDDDLDEDDETVIVTMEAPVNASLGVRTVWKVTINDDDSEPAVTFNRGSGTVEENGDPVTITAILSTVSGKNVTVPFTVSGTARGLEDYTVTPSPLVIEAGSLRGDITFTLVDDAMKEDDESVKVSMDAPVNATPGERTVHTFILRDNDTEPSVVFTKASQSVPESAGVVTITAELSETFGKNVTVPFTVYGTASEPEDYTVTPSPLVIEAGSLRGDITFTLVDDAMKEDDESVKVAMDAPIFATPGERTIHTLTIRDNDPKPEASFTLGSSVRDESSGSFLLEVSLSSPNSRVITVDFEVTGGSAAEGIDYILERGTLSFDPGEMVKNVAVEVIDDALFEENETIRVSLMRPTNALLREPTAHTHTISDDDKESTVPIGDPTRKWADLPIAVLPVENLSGVSAPAEEIRNFLIARLQSEGMIVLGDRSLDTFMARHRMRFVGGIDEEIGRAMVEETGAQAVLLTSLELYYDKRPPRIALTARMVSTGLRPEILWMESEGFSGDESPGLLDLGLIEDPEELLNKILLSISKSLMDYLSGDGFGAGERIRRKFQPKSAYRSPLLGKNLREIPVAFSLESSRGSEDMSPAMLNVTLPSKSDREVRVNYEVTGGNAEGRGKDYTLDRGTLTFKPGETVRPIAVPIIDDRLNEEAETIRLALLNPVNAVIGVPAVHTYTIIDEDPEPAVSFSQTGLVVLERDKGVLITIELSEPSGKDVTVPLLFSGTAKEGVDYTVTPNPLTIHAGNVMGSVTLTTIDDERDEEDETVIATIGAPSNATLGEAMVHTLTIQDDDPLSGIFFSKSESSSAETISPAIIDVILTSKSDRIVTVDFDVIGGTATGDGTDYTLQGGTIIFKPGETVKPIEVQINDDVLDEADETIDIALAHSVNAVPVLRDFHTYTIIDNDPEPAVAFVSPARRCDENAGSVQILAELSTASGRDVAVPFTLSRDGKEPAGIDLVTPSPLIIGAGEQRGQIIIALLDDALDEGDDSITVTMGTPLNATPGDIIEHTLIVSDNDPEPGVSFLLPSSRGSEAQNPATIDVTLTAESGREVTVDFAVNGGTATGTGADYTLKEGTVTFKPGEKVKSIEVPIQNDEINEEDETIEIALANPVNAVLVPQVLHTYTITDDDPEPAVAFSSNEHRASEKDGVVTITVEMSEPSGKDVTVPFSVGGTADNSVDYRVASNSITIGAGSLGESVTLTILDDGLDEIDETVRLTLGKPTNGTPGSIGEHTVTIADDDPEPTVSFGGVTFLGAREGDEGNAVTVEIVLSSVSSKDVTIPFHVRGTAREGVDYTISPNPLTVSSGETTGKVSITVVDDALDEDNETITITLVSPTNAMLGENVAWSFTITDNDEAPTVTFDRNGQEVDEKGGTATITVWLSDVSGRDVAVPFTAGGSASESKDYGITSSPLVIPAGSLSGEVTVTLVDDVLDEYEETVEVTMGEPTNAVRGSIAAHKLTIKDDDDPPRIAVLPFFNKSSRRNAGEIVMLHFVRQLEKHGNVTVIEPGVVRRELLGLRIIMDDGISLANTDLVFSTLNADLVLTGTVLDYEDDLGTGGVPKVDFSAVLLGRKNREILWSSKSQNEGDDGVFFFDRGRVYTANEMAAEMAGSIVKLLLENNE